MNDEFNRQVQIALSILRELKKRGIKPVESKEFMRFPIDIRREAGRLLDK